MPPPQWHVGPMAAYTFTKRNVPADGLSKKFEDPNDRGCHGWGCYTGAEKTGIIFMSIIVPLVLFLIIWILIIRPMDDVSISSRLSGTEQSPTQATQDIVQLPRQQTTGQVPYESQSAPQEENGQPTSSPGRAAPVRPHGLRPASPEPGPALLPQSQESGGTLPLKILTSAVPSSASATMYQSPTIVVNIDTSQLGDSFAPIVTETAVETLAEKHSTSEAGQKHNQEQEQDEQRQRGQTPGSLPDGQFEQPVVSHGPQRTIPSGGRMSFIPFSPFSFFPPGTSTQIPGRPVCIAAPQFVTVLPPPPPPLAVQPKRTLTGTSTLRFSGQMPQKPLHRPTVAPPGILKFRQPSSLVTRKASSCTAEQSEMSQSHKRFLMKRAHTISDLRSNHVSSGNLRKPETPGMKLPSETSSGKESLQRESSSRQGPFQTEDHGKDVGSRKKAACAASDADKATKRNYQQRSRNGHKHLIKRRTAQRQRPAGSASSRSRSPHMRSSLHKRPAKHGKARKESFLASLIPMALGAIGIVADEPEKQRKHLQAEGRHETGKPFEKEMYKKDWKAERPNVASFRRDQRTLRHDDSSSDRRSKQMAAPERMREKSVNSEAEDNRSSSHSSSFWRFQDSDSVQREELVRNDVKKKGKTDV